MVQFWADVPAANATSPPSPISWFCRSCAVSAPCPSTAPRTNQVVASADVIQYAFQRLWYRYPAPRPGTTFKVTATQPADAARISCLVGAMVLGLIGRLWRPNSVTKGVTKAFWSPLLKPLRCRRSELVQREVRPS